MLDPVVVRVESLAVAAYALLFACWSMSGPAAVDKAGDARLVVTVSGQNANPAQRIVRNGSFIGRGPECDVRVDDGSVAKWQARLTFDGFVTTLEVLDDTVTTSVNDRVVRGGVALAQGDRIGVGSVTILFDGVSFDRS